MLEVSKVIPNDIRGMSSPLTLINMRHQNSIQDLQKKMFHLKRCK